MYFISTKLKGIILGISILIGAIYKASPIRVAEVTRFTRTCVYSPGKALFFGNTTTLFWEFRPMY